MKAIYSKDLITINNFGDGSVKIYTTDVYNVSYCLSKCIFPSRLILNDDSFDFYRFQDYVLSILKQQKSIRAVCQKFNAICKALDL